MTKESGREKHGHMLRLPAMALGSLPSVALSSKQVVKIVIKPMKNVNKRYFNNPMEIYLLLNGIFFDNETNFI